MRRIITIITLVLLGVPPYSGAGRLPLLERNARFTATSAALSPTKPGARRVGALVFERGYRLRSADPAFGGFSSLAVAGEHFLLLSDGGNIVRFRLDAAGVLSERGVATLPGGPGSGWNKEDRDSESLTTDGRHAQFWVGFERANAVWRFGSRLERAQAHSYPSAMARWPENGGPEAMIRLRDGRFVIVSETAHPPRRPDARAALLFSGDPVARGVAVAKFAYVPPRGFSPTDAAELPGGDLLVLNRRFSLFSGFESVLTLVPRGSLASGGTAKGVELARFKPPLLHDNFEGIAVIPEAHGVGLWIVSDDNQSLFQQSLLLKFRLDDDEVARALASR